MSILRRERRQWQPEPQVPPFPGAYSYGRGSQPSSMSALQSSAVWGCVHLIASTVAMMPLEAYTLRAGVRVPIDNPSLLKTPDAGVTLHDWVYMVLSSLLLRGNAYGRILARDAMGYPTQINLLNPDDVAARRDPSSGVTTYSVKGVAVDSRELWHVRAFRLPGLDVGLSPVQFAAYGINRDQAIQQFALGYFQDAPNPASVLTSDQAITAEHARTLKERISAAILGRDVLVLGAGLSFKPLAVSPEESQFLATQKYGAAEICRIYRVPPQKIAAADVGSSMTYSTVELAGIDFLTYTIQDWLTILESAIAPLMPGQKHVRFNTSVLLRTDLETRMKSAAIGIASKQLTPDEARQWSDMPPLTEEQKKILALVPLDISPTGMPKALPPAAGDQEAVTTEPSDTPTSTGAPL